MMARVGTLRAPGHLGAERPLFGERLGRCVQPLWVKRGTLASVLEAGVRQRGPNNMVARLLVIRMDSNEHKCQ